MDIFNTYIKQTQEPGNCCHSDLSQSYSKCFGSPAAVGKCFPSMPSCICSRCQIPYAERIDTIMLIRPIQAVQVLCFPTGQVLLQAHVYNAFCYSCIGVVPRTSLLALTSYKMPMSILCCKFLGCTSDIDSRVGHLTAVRHETENRSNGSVQARYCCECCCDSSVLYC